MLASCSFIFGIKPDGRINDVSFRFYETPEFEKQIKINLLNLVVQEQFADSEWTTIWELKGSAVVDVIEYGSPVDGLVQMMEAKPMSELKVYRVLVHGQHKHGPQGSFRVYFTFESSGKLIRGKP